MRSSELTRRLKAINCRRHRERSGASENEDEDNQDQKGSNRFQRWKNLREGEEEVKHADIISQR